MDVEDLSGDLNQPDQEIVVEQPQSSQDVIRDAIAKQRVGADDKGETKVETANQDGRVRDEQGRFAAQDQKISAPKPAHAVQSREAAPAGEPGAIVEAPMAHKAPGGFSPAAKIAFESAAPELREAIAKREAEVDAGFKKYAGVDQYVRMAEQSGTTLPVALENYVQIEAVLRKDPVAGIQRIAQNMGINPVALANAVIHRAGPGTSQQVPREGQPQLQDAIQRPVDEGALTSKIMQQIEARTAHNSMLNEIAAFSSDPENRFFENVKGHMAAIMQYGAASTLKDAYDQACWANPEIRAHLVKSQAGSLQKRVVAATQAKAAAKAVTGAPGPGTRPGGAPPPNETTHDTVRRAVEEARGAI